MKLSVMTLPLLPMPDIPGLKQESKPKKPVSLVDIYGQIKAAGVNDLDISSIDFQFGGEVVVLSALEEADLQCACYLAFIEAPRPSPEGQAQAVSEGKRAVDQTLRLGADVMMFVPAGYQEAVAVMSRQELADSFAEVLRPVTAYAAERGVTVAIEDAPHREFPMCAEAELRYLLETVPGLKLVYDSGNMLWAGEDPVEYYDHLAEYVAHAHLKEVGRAPDGTLTECCPGNGSVDFQRIFRHMRRHGFEGFMAIELPPDFSAEESIGERVHQAVNYLTPLLERSIP